MTHPHQPTAGLRARREALGLSLEQMHAETRIPLEHLRAIEEGRLSDLPEGPWRTAWVRAYEARIGADPDAHDAPEPPHVAARPSVPLWLVQTVAVVAGVALISGIAWQVMHGFGPGPTSHDPGAPAGPPDQHVTVQAARNGAQVKIVVDGEEVVDRTLANGEVVEVAGHRRVEVHLSAVEAARVTWNGETIVPQGRQDEARRLVFVDDLEGGP